jgi:hypothetical protein
MGAAFGLQCLSGFIVAQWSADGGHHPAIAHEAAMATGLGLQLIALGFFLTPKPRRRPAAMAHEVARSLRGSPSPVVRPVYSSWTLQAEIARRQRAAWRLAAAASATLCLGVGATLSIAVSRPAVALHVIELSPQSGPRTYMGRDKVSADSYSAGGRARP